MLEKIIEIVKEAAKLFKVEEMKVTEKSSISDIVTSVDLAISEFLEVEMLKLDDSLLFLSEEKEEIGNPENYKYVVIADPVDGTKNLFRNMGNSAISVAVLKDGVLTYGVVYNLFNHDLYYAELGKGSFLNGKKLNVSNNAFNQSIICTGFAIYKKELAIVCQDILKAIYLEIDDFRRLGACSLELSILAAGYVDLYFEIRVNPWDYLAGKLLIEEAGGYLSEIAIEPQENILSPVLLIAANNLENLKRLEQVVLNEVEKHGIIF